MTWVSVLKVKTNVMKIEKVCWKLRKYKKVCQMMRKCAKTWESTRKWARNLRKYDKNWESEPKLEKVLESVLHAIKAMRSIKRYACYAKIAELRVISTSVITVINENNSITLMLT